MDKLKLMDTYVRVVRGGSFAAAADQLGVSRGVVTKHIAKLEQALGVRLLNRTTRRLSPTEIGVDYLEFCGRTLREIDDTESVMARLQDEPRGTIKVAAPKAFASLYLGDLVGEFSTRHPNIEIMAFVGDSPMDQINLVENGYDLVIRLSRPLDSSIVSRRLCTIDWIACASPDYLKRAGKPRTPQDLTALQCLTHTRLTADNIWRFSGREESAIKVSGPVKSNSVLVLRGSTLAGAGIALLPTYCVADDLAAGRLVRVLPDCTGPAEEVFVLFPYSHQEPKKVRLFVDYLAEKLHTPPWAVN